MRPWTKTQQVPGTSVVNGGIMLLNAEGRCVGLVTVMNAEEGVRTQVSDALAAYGSDERNPSYADLKSDVRTLCRILLADKSLDEVHRITVEAVDARPLPEDELQRELTQLREEVARLRVVAQGRFNYISMMQQRATKPIEQLQAYTAMIANLEKVTQQDDGEPNTITLSDLTTSRGDMLELITTLKTGLHLS